MRFRSRKARRMWRMGSQHFLMHWMRLVWSIAPFQMELLVLIYSFDHNRNLPVSKRREPTARHFSTANIFAEQMESSNAIRYPRASNMFTGPSSVASTKLLANDACIPVESESQLKMCLIPNCCQHSPTLSIQHHYRHAPLKQDMVVVES